MNIILLERIEKLGQIGDLVTVKSGYARNFLLPQGKAVFASKENIKMFEDKKAQLEGENIERKKEAQNLANNLNFKEVFNVDIEEISKYIKRSLAIAHKLALNKNVKGIINCPINKQIFYPKKIQFQHYH